jgi:hypothetical protein
MSATTALGAPAVLWAGVGPLLALVMGRHGHDQFAWWLPGSRVARLSKVLLRSPATTLAAHAEVPAVVAAGASSPAWRG